MKQVLMEDEVRKIAKEVLDAQAIEAGRDPKEYDKVRNFLTDFFVNGFRLGNTWATEEIKFLRGQNSDLKSLLRKQSSSKPYHSLIRLIKSFTSRAR